MIQEPFHLERFFARHEFTTRHLLAVSDCQSMTVGELLALEPGAREALDDVWLGYTESEGGKALRQAVAGSYTALEPDHILVHAAGVEVLFTLAHAVLRPGDHAVVQAPCYQALRSAPELAGAEVTLWHGDPDAGWAPSLDRLPELFRPETRLLAVNTPHNPTGHHFTEEELRRLVEETDRRGIQLFVDEAYRGAEHRDGDRIPSVAELSPRAAALGLLSKAYGLPGLRLGWLATRNRHLREAAARVKDFTTICAPAPAEFLGALALRHGGVVLSRTRRILGRNLAALEAFMARHPEDFHWIPPRAGSVAFPLLRREGAEPFCQAAREEAGVLLAPGRLFDAGVEAVRFGYGREGFREGLAALEEWMEKR